MRIIGMLLAATMLPPGAAAAVPVGVDYDLLRGTVEDFNRLAPGSGGGTGPAAYKGFSVTTDVAHWALVSDEEPCSPADHCLHASISPLFSPFIGFPTPPVTATFTDFAPNTRSFGLRLPGTFADISGVIEGVSGTTSLPIFNSDPGSPLGPLKLAWHDPAGLLSVTITHPADYDDVVTSSLAPVPLPPAGAAMLIALGGLALLRRRHAMAQGAGRHQSARMTVSVTSSAPT